MKAIFKFISVSLLILSALFSFAADSSAYWFGYLKMLDSLVTLRAAVLLFGLVMSFVFTVVLIYSVVRKRGRVFATSLLAGFLFVAGMSLIPTHTDELTLFGLRDRILHDCKADTLRDFAKDVDHLPAPRNSQPGIGKVFMHDDLTALTGSLGKKYNRLLGDNSPSSVEDANGLVYVWWGREQWGFCVIIDRNASGRMTIESDNKTILPVSDDIFFIANSGIP